MKRLAGIAGILALLMLLMLPVIARAALSPADARAAFGKGNFKDAYDALSAAGFTCRDRQTGR